MCISDPNFWSAEEKRERRKIFGEGEIFVLRRRRKTKRRIFWEKHLVSGEEEERRG